MKLLPTIPKSALLLALLAAGGRAPSIEAQSALDRPPNLTGAWTGGPGTIHFNFIHRFQVSDPPLRKVSNSPTFTVATGLGRRSMVGFAWASSSDLVPAYPNEWEFFGRWVPVAREAGHALDLSLQAGYNLAAESVDAELLVAREAGPLRLLAAGRVFSDAYATEESRFAVAGGASVRLTRWLALSGDVGSLVDPSDAERWTWGAGLQLGIPYTPHSLSIHATNVNTGTLQGTSRGSRTRWGFEYTVPITLERYIPGLRSGGRSDGEAAEGRGGDPTSPEAPAGVPAPGYTLTVEIRELAYGREEIRVAPGTTVTWVNRDPLVHTVTDDDGSFDSDSIEPDASWSRTFDENGTFSYHCTPHPFMTGRVVVQGSMEDDR